MTDLMDARPAVPGPRRPEPGPADPHRPQPAEPPSVHLEGVELTRLIARAQLTVAQGVELAAAVSAAAAVQECGQAAGNPDRTSVLAGPVVIGADGRVVAGRSEDVWGDATTAAAGGPARVPLAPVLADLAAAVRPRARHAGPAAERLVAELDAAVAELPVAGTAATARRLRDVAAELDGGSVRAELGALVRAIGGQPPPQGGRSTGFPGAAADAAPRRPPTAPRARTTLRRISAWLVSLLVLAGVVVAEVGLLRDHIAADVGSLLDAGRGGAAPSSAADPSPAPGGRLVPVPAPAAAGGVTGVDLRSLAPCVPGSPCTVRVQVRLVPRPDGQVVRWSFHVADRCTSGTVRVPGGTVAAPPGAARVDAVGVVALPAPAPAVAVFAVTDAPAVAASPPLLAGSCPAPAVGR